MERYKLVRRAMTWSRANLYCKNLGRRLMEVRTHEEYNNACQLRRNLGPIRIWLGGTNKLRGHEGNWVWLSNAERIDLRRFWGEKEPNAEPNEHCLELNNLGMNDIICGRVFRFVCEAA